MSDVPQIWRTVLDAMPSGWTTPAALAARLGRDVEETTDLLASLDEAGLIRVREPEGADGPVVSLSNRGTAITRPAPPRGDRRPVGAGASSPSWGTQDRPRSPRMAATAAGSVAS